MPDFVLAQVSMSRDITKYEQNFDMLPMSDSALWESGTQFSKMPGWSIQRTKLSSHILVSDGQGNIGGLFSYGKIATPERALGSISSLKKGEFAWGLLLQNKSNDTITNLDISFYGEQWRVSNKTAPQHQIAFFYAISKDPMSFNLSPKSDVNWIPVPALYFKGPRFGIEGGKFNGNAPENRQLLSASIPVKIPDGAYVMLRWKDADEIESDHGLAIDDFSMTWTVKAQMPLPLDNIILPVDLISFSAKLRNEIVELLWQTATEEQNDYFEVERSTDGKTFGSLGKVRGNGTTALRSSYRFVDTMPLSGTTYYRLKQVDKDGTSTYSSIVPIAASARNVIVQVYPTSTAQVLSVNAPASVNLKHALILNTLGQKVLTLQQLVANAMGQYLIDVSALQNGSYVLVLYSQNGERLTNRFIKH